ncbi:uroporphyrinogen decarboxylase family protein [Parasporobacterium paucivorans]|uniref:Uroporphyrinogen decarboxylase (URO-D) n=1 Tax=Parasporobacterium paucivorans DSM 15970 TaxID=1122934 RepID=A0A1M6HVT2_9FIRM|nr:uroporphyrinogen decarboxylase family protein [Parasporobacterium paucivorans]SHJ26299.1 Uroporphyrinogen decarboxylase (URO-D) [Parasporobacterium paucivorans DSM 15970]
MNAAQNFLETLRGGTPKAFVNEWEPFGLVFDPLMAATLTGQKGKTVIDPWGVTVYWGENEPGVMPIINDDTKVCKDITMWKEQVKYPDLANMDLDWSMTVPQVEGIKAEGKLVTSLLATGLYEQAHYLMGFEDALMNFLLEPESMHELLDYLTEYKMMYAKLLVENLHPDVILWHDDWGSKTSLFMSAEIWREFFKPRYEKIFKYFKDNGVIVMVHADSFLEPIVHDMVDVGIDIWQGVLPQNDIPRLQKELEGKMILMGGVDAQKIDFEDITEENIRAEVARCCKEYAPGGGFIPCLTYGGPGSIFPEVDFIIQDEINNQSKIYFN